RWLESELAAWPYFQADGEPLTGYQPLVELRTAAAKLLGVNVDELAVTQNATMGMSFVANGLDLAAGDEVLSTDHEHVGGITCWRLRAQRHGVVVKELPLSPALAGGPEAIVKLFADAITPKTRVLSFSHITSGLGILLPARELCALARERGIFSVVAGARLDDAREHGVGRPREGRVPLHAVRHRRGAGGRRPARRAAVRRGPRHRAHRALGRD